MRQLNGNVALLKVTLSNSNNSEHFQIIHRENPSPFFQPLALQKSLPTDVECVNFPNIFQNTYFHKTLLCNCFCISLHYLVFQNNFFGNCRWKFFIMWKSNWQLYHERSNTIREIFMLFAMLQRITLHNKFYNIFAYATANSLRGALYVV